MTGREATTCKLNNMIAQLEGSLLTNKRLVRNELALICLCKQYTRIYCESYGKQNSLPHLASREIKILEHLNANSGLVFPQEHLNFNSSQYSSAEHGLEKALSRFFFELSNSTISESVPFFFVQRELAKLAYLASVLRRLRLQYVAASNPN